MKKILILFAHPAFQKSRVNKQLVHGLQNMEGITFFDLYENYPELDIDVKEQQALLSEHDVIIFHHPFFWYSTPAILKEWQDLVLEHGWAYGREGDALKGKHFFNIISTGGGRKAYSVEGFHGVTMRQLLLPLEKTAKLCKMIFLPPYVVHGSFAVSEEDVKNHGQGYLQLLMDMRDEQIEPDTLTQLDYLNDYIDNKPKDKL